MYPFGTLEGRLHGGASLPLLAVEADGAVDVTDGVAQHVGFSCLLGVGAERIIAQRRCRIFTIQRPHVNYPHHAHPEHCPSGAELVA